jgi:hypothetical protein
MKGTPPIFTPVTVTLSSVVVPPDRQKNGSLNFADCVVSQQIVQLVTDSVPTPLKVNRGQDTDIDESLIRVTVDTETLPPPITNNDPLVTVDLIFFNPSPLDTYENSLSPTFNET